MEGGSRVKAGGGEEGGSVAHTRTSAHTQPHVQAFPPLSTPPPHTHTPRPQPYNPPSPTPAPNLTTSPPSGVAKVQLDAIDEGEVWDDWVELEVAKGAKKASGECVCVCVRVCVCFWLHPNPRRCARDHHPCA